MKRGRFNSEFSYNEQILKVIEHYRKFCWIPFFEYVIQGGIVGPILRDKGEETSYNCY